MTADELKRFAEIPQIPHGDLGFLEDLKRPLEDHFKRGDGCYAGPTHDCLNNGFKLQGISDGASRELETVWPSLRRLFAAKGVPETADGYPVRFTHDGSLGREEYGVDVAVGETVVTAADADGLRRGAYFLEDRLREAAGASITSGRWRRKPLIKQRISRCFFGPTYRPPFMIDELANDVDYYPDEYLNKLAHEGINGLWLTMYFRDLPSTVFPHFGNGSERRLDKLRQTVKKCARYGIRIYVFFSEPKAFGDSPFTIPESAAEKHPELVVAYGKDGGGGGSFCTSTDAGKKYLAEALRHLFAAVPGLGGVINIMLGEDNGSCVSRQLQPFGRCSCPACTARPPAELFREQAEIMANAIHETRPDAEFIGWFYAPGQRDGSAFMHRLADAVTKWPADCGVMFNFESGGVSEQLGKGRTVFDYSLAYLGPSELFRKVAETCAKPVAKLQVGCSHENAAVPFIPVPSNLYEKYRVMHELGVGAALQCWYFGNYPGLMNKAAGELSFAPFPENEAAFLTGLARPDWRQHTPTVVRAWQHFATGYRKFPANIAFAWYGPLHNAIVWPLHLFPVDGPIAPSWLLNDFPTVSGDRIGECLIYHHTLAEALTLCREMDADWSQGAALLNGLAGEYAADPDRTKDIGLAQAIALQIKSTCNLLQFYTDREAMFYDKTDQLAAMKDIVRDEIANAQAMTRLCAGDSRLGYHSEAEGYLFYPAKLAGRIKLLEQLLDEDFARFDLHAPWIDEYTGATPQGAVAYCRQTGPAAQYPIGDRGGKYWAPSYDERYLHLEFGGLAGEAFNLEIEPCRLWPPVRLQVDADGTPHFYDFIFREPPVPLYSHENARVTVSIPLSAFDGYRRENFPMRINVRTDQEAWVNETPWPPRLLHENFNPRAAGWLRFA